MILGLVLCVDLYCGLGGWAEGFLAEGWSVVGFDVERHRYPRRVFGEQSGSKCAVHGVELGAKGIANGDARHRSFSYPNECTLREAALTGGWDEYPGQLVLQDVLTLHGSQFRDADCIVASPPCQGYSYRAMPWKRAKSLPPPDNALFEACFRIQREASEAAGRYIPMVVENVCGAQRWVGRARWHYGSFYLWGDVPALMPWTLSLKIPGFRFDGSSGSFQTAAVKVASASGRRTDPGNGVRFTSRDCGMENEQPVWFNDDKRKWGGDWFGSGEDCSLMRHMSSRSNARKAASAQIAKIPFELAAHIARVYKS